MNLFTEIFIYIPYYMLCYKSSPPCVLYKIVFLTISLLKMRLQLNCFSLSFEKSFTIPFLHTTYERLLLLLQNSVLVTKM